MLSTGLNWRHTALVMILHSNKVSHGHVTDLASSAVHTSSAGFYLHLVCLVRGGYRVCLKGLLRRPPAVTVRNPSQTYTRRATGPWHLAPASVCQTRLRRRCSRARRCIHGGITGRPPTLCGTEACTGRALHVHSPVVLRLDEQRKVSLAPKTDDTPIHNMLR